MDRAVLDACDWSDISIACDLLLDYEIDEAAWGSKKKPCRSTECPAAWKCAAESRPQMPSSRPDNLTQVVSMIILMS